MKIHAAITCGCFLSNMADNTTPNADRNAAQNTTNGEGNSQRAIQLLQQATMLLSTNTDKYSCTGHAQMRLRPAASHQIEPQTINTVFTGHTIRSTEFEDDIFTLRTSNCVTGIGISMCTTA